VQAVYDHLKPLRIIHLKAARELGRQRLLVDACERTARFDEIDTAGGSSGSQ
jgi:hypothetical protein